VQLADAKSPRQRKHSHCVGNPLRGLQKAFSFQLSAISSQRRPLAANWAMCPLKAESQGKKRKTKNETRKTESRGFRLSAFGLQLGGGLRPQIGARSAPLRAES
jgi:hypothetical protein